MSSGVSFLQGGHQLPEKYTTTYLFSSCSVGIITFVFVLTKSLTVKWSQRRLFRESPSEEAADDDDGVGVDLFIRALTADTAEANDGNGPDDCSSAFTAGGGDTVPFFATIADFPTLAVGVGGGRKRFAARTRSSTERTTNSYLKHILMRLIVDVSMMPSFRRRNVKPDTADFIALLSDRANVENTSVDGATVFFSST